jgi:hypothetical protein
MWSLLAISLFERFSRSASRTSFSRRDSRAGPAGPRGRPHGGESLVHEPREQGPRNPEASPGDLLDGPGKLLRGLREGEQALGAEAQQREGGALLELLGDEHDAGRRIPSENVDDERLRRRPMRVALDDIEGRLRDREALGVRHEVGSSRRAVTAKSSSDNSRSNSESTSG